MGQLFLGFRSLLLKSAVFVVMAALLAWALGGTLFPRPTRVQLHAATYQGVQFEWRLSVLPARTVEVDSPQELIHWELMRRDGDGQAHSIEDLKWFEVAGPVIAEGLLHFAGRPVEAGHESTGWVLASVDAQHRIVERVSLPDRLAVEVELARLRASAAASSLDSPAESAEVMMSGK